MMIVGECGLGFHELDETKARIKKVQRIKYLDDKKIEKVRSGDFCSFAISKQNQIYSWGLNDSLQIGQKEKRVYDSPTLLSLPSSLPPFKEIKLLFIFFFLIFKRKKKVRI